MGYTAEGGPTAWQNESYGIQEDLSTGIQLPINY